MGNNNEIQIFSEMFSSHGLKWKQLFRVPLHLGRDGMGPIFSRALAFTSVCHNKSIFFSDNI